MPNLWDKTPEAPSPSDLNPLTNPVLERNLGRWAKVYFGNPPEKREQAVSNLLEQIKRESGSGAAAQPARPYFATDTRFQRAVCSACQHQNPPGHKFCSRCGQALNAGRTGSMDNLGALRISEAPPANFANDMEWSRNPELSSLDDSDPQGRGWKYLVGVFVIVLAGFAYVNWAPELRTLVSPRTATAPQVSDTSAAFPRENPSPALAKSSAQATAPVPPESNASEGQNPSATAETRGRTVAPNGIQPAVQKSPLLAAPTSRQMVVDQESDASDLRLAQRYLGGSMGVRDSSEAAKLLWKAVSKQNATAAVLLSDLYLRGDGVPRSCDQARLLLVAAAKRGSPLAAQQLRNLESRRCD
jgi:ribosomal protein L40E